MEADFVRTAIVGCRRLERETAPRGGASAGHTATCGGVPMSVQPLSSL